MPSGIGRSPDRWSGEWRVRAPDVRTGGPEGLDGERAGPPPYATHMTTTDRQLRIVTMPVTHPVAAELIARVEAELCARYQVSSIGTLRPTDFEPDGGGAFLVACLGDQAVGCGGIRRLRPDVAELKRMFVDAAARRQGVARALLGGLEAAARQAGYRELWLETGTEQPEAIALYLAAGYLPMAPFEPHASRVRPGDPCLVQHDSRSRFFGRPL